MPATLSPEYLVPTRASTNFFDPNDGQNVIARYANTALAVSQAGGAAAEMDKYDRSRLERIAARRADTRWDREEQDWQDRQDYKIQRGNFLTEISALDPLAPDYWEKRSAIHAALPPEAQKDDAVRDIISGKDHQANQKAAVEQRDLDRQEAFADRVRLQHIKFANDPRLAVLTAEERSKYVDPQTGELDWVGASQHAYEKSRANKVEDAGRTAQARLDVTKMSKGQKDLYKAMQDAVKDTDTFTLQSQYVYNSRDPKTGKLLYAGMKPEDVLAQQTAEGRNDMREAMEWDKNQFESELMAAAKRGTRQEYIDLNKGKLNARQKELRGRMWDLAQTLFPGDTAPAATANLKETASAPAPVVRKYNPATGKIE